MFIFNAKYSTELEQLKVATKEAGDCRKAYDLYGMQLMAMMSSTMEYNKKDTWGHTKTTTINGLKVKESYLKDDKYNLSLFYGDRFAVDIETHEVGKEELEQIPFRITTGTPVQ